MTPEATLLLAWLDEADAPAWVADGVADALPKIETAIEAEATATLEAEVSRLRAALAVIEDNLRLREDGSTPTGESIVQSWNVAMDALAPVAPAPAEPRP